MWISLKSLIRLYHQSYGWGRPLRSWSVAVGQAATLVKFGLREGDHRAQLASVCCAGGL